MAGWQVGAWATVALVIQGPSPVTFVQIDLVGDGYPGWYFSMGDARGAYEFPVGPIRRRGTYQVVVEAIDAQGCSGSIGVGPYVTIP